MVAVIDTVYVPAAAYAWTGFWAVLEAPSPKFHDQEAGLPVLASVNRTVWLTAGAAGEGDGEPGFHVERAGAPDAAGADAERHALERAERIDGVVMAQDQDGASAARRGE